MKTLRILAVAALLASATVQAAEMTLYENPGFGGRQLTLRSYTPDINTTGFNDKASSTAVRSGNWEVCTDADFNGFCASLTPGEYRLLDTRFNDRISSAREVGATAAEVGRPRYEPRGGIEMYARPDFRGSTMQLDCDTPDLAAPAEHGGGGTQQPGPAGAARAVLFGGDNLRGRSMAISDNVVDLQSTGFNDDTASMVIEGGSWEVCTDAYFRGECRIMAPGQYRRLDPVSYRSIS